MIDVSKKLTLAVVGDVMTDEYLEGKFTRFAQEGGQPVFETGTVVRVPGGAANTAAQLMHWNAHAELYGCVVGAKRRLSAGGNYFLREDQHVAVDGADRSKMMDALTNELRHFNGVLISDYDHGTLREEDVHRIIAACREKGIPVFADPKHKAPEVYDSCTVVKCNRAYHDQHGWACTQTVVTNGSFSPEVKGEPSLPQLPPVHVASVVGAGDCFHAALACAVVRGMPLLKAAELAHSAGRVYVQRPHDLPVHPLEVVKDLDPLDGKIVEPNQLAELLRLRNNNIVVANGCFDVLHPGHLATLRWAKEQGDTLVVAVNTDESMARIKRQPKMRCRDRMTVLAGLSCVDWVVSFGEDTPCKLLKVLGTGKLIKGNDCFNKKLVECPDQWSLWIAPSSGFNQHSSDMV